MGHLVKFPKEPRSQLEKAIRDAISQSKHRNLSANSIKQVVRNVTKASERLAVVNLQLSYNVPGHFSPHVEVVAEIKRIAERAATQGISALQAKVLAERVNFEIALALAGWDWTEK